MKYLIVILVVTLGIPYTDSKVRTTKVLTEEASFEWSLHRILCKDSKQKD